MDPIIIIIMICIFVILIVGCGTLLYFYSGYEQDSSQLQMSDSESIPISSQPLTLAPESAPAPAPAPISKPTPVPTPTPAPVPTSSPSVKFSIKGINGNEGVKYYFQSEGKNVNVSEIETIPNTFIDKKIPIPSNATKFVIHFATNYKKYIEIKDAKIMVGNKNIMETAYNDRIKKWLQEVPVNPRVNMVRNDGKLAWPGPYIFTL